MLFRRMGWNNVLNISCKLIEQISIKGLNKLIKFLHSFIKLEKYFSNYNFLT